MESKLNGICKYYFVQACLKRYASGLLTSETEHNSKLNNQMTFTEEDRLYHDANNTCHKCNESCIIKVTDHCHETGKQRGPACSICYLNINNKTSFRLYSIMVAAMISINFIVIFFNRIMTKNSR